MSDQTVQSAAPTPGVDGIVVRILDQDHLPKFDFPITVPIYPGDSLVGKVVAASDDHCEKIGRYTILKPGVGGEQVLNGVPLRLVMKPEDLAKMPFFN